jgi:hypothetical protein
MIDPSFAQRAPRSQYGCNEEQPTWVASNRRARSMLSAMQFSLARSTLCLLWATTLRESTYAPMSVDLSFSSSRHTNSSGGATLELMRQVRAADPSSPRYRHSYCGSEPTHKPSRSRHIDAATSLRFRIPCTLRSNDRLWASNLAGT